jgi:N-acyl-D-aspartate/D-glutamate deacylase
MCADSRFDLVVRGGRAIDGTGVPAYLADVGVRDGRMARVGRISSAESAAARHTPSPVRPAS